MPDLIVDTVALRSALVDLRRALAVAEALPLDADSAYRAYDMGSGPVGSAAAHFLEGWYGGVRAMRRSGASLEDWLTEAAGHFEELEAELARAVGG